MTIRTPRPAADQARDLVADPHLAGDLPPAVLADAWATLMQARGRAVRVDRLGPPRHLIDRNGDCEALSDLMAGRAMRIRAAIARRGNPRPAPLILRDAVRPELLPGA